jgi:serine/threonine protein kinase
MIGSRLAHYEITSHLGFGGMGDVYQATDTKYQRPEAALTGNRRSKDCAFKSSVST